MYGSHNLHEVTMYYPMRFVRTRRYKLIHNINYFAPFPIDQDFYISDVFQVGIKKKSFKVIAIKFNIPLRTCWSAGEAGRIYTGSRT